MLHILRLAYAAPLAMTALCAAADGDLRAPEGPVVLTVSGAISTTNGDKVALFDRDMLQDLPRTDFSTTTIWTDGAHVFSGVPLRALVDALDAQGDTIIATAINNYSVEIPVASLTEMPIIADLMDGEEMSVRGKGPLWIVYPYDLSDEFRTEVVYSRSIWQLDRLEVK